MPNQSYVQPGGHYGPDTPAYVPQAGDYNTGGVTPNGSGNAYANNAINNANAQFGSITQSLREANEANKRKIDSEVAGETQDARDFEFKSQNFARAQLGKIGGEEGTYKIGLQNSIAQRTEKNIQGIKRAGEEAKASGDFQLSSRLAELGLQQMTLLAQLNAQAFEQTKFNTQMDYQRGRDTVADEQFRATEARLGKDFTQLDNGDYGYFDVNTNKFVKLGNAVKPASGGGGYTDPVSGLPKGFTAATDAGRSELQKGVSWGDVWNRIRAQFPTVTNEQIDTFLGGSAGTVGTFSQERGSTEGRTASGWAREGTYEDFKRASLADTYNSKSSTQINAEINMAISEDPETWASMTTAEKQNFIRSQGGMPEDFGY